MKLWVLLPMVSMLAGAPASARELTLEQRIEAQKAIEQVYWRHRVWPKENPSSKPPLSTVMNDAALRAKVEDYLKKSSTLESYWHRPITAEQLQAELDRMSRSSRDPQILRELYTALGNDPFVIAETLARQTLAERLIRSWYASDDRVHGATRERVTRSLDPAPSVAEMSSLGGEYGKVTITRRRLDATASRRTTDVDDEEWSATLGDLANRFETSSDGIPLRRVSRLREDSDRWSITAVLALGANEVTIARVTWHKRSFDDWWSHERPTARTDVAASGVSFSTTAPSDSGCADDTWNVKLYVPSGRIGHTAIWTGTEMIVWGGASDSEPSPTGARYNPTTDTWTPTSLDANTPPPVSGTAVWTGSEMIVWGTTSGGTSGGRYNPASDSWTSMSQGAGVPSPRYGFTTVWTGSRMIVWGGYNNTTYFNSGSRYDPSTDSWAATSIGTGVPATRYGHTAIWSGSEMIVWGGYNGAYLPTGGRYNPTSNSWTATPLSAGIPAARTDHSAVWTGTEMVIWGGRNTANLNSGSRYNPSANTWTGLPATTLTARYNHTAIWSGSAMIVWGGSFADGGLLNTGASWIQSTNTWSILPTTNAPTARHGHTAIWTGSEMIVWGGYDSGNDYAYTGGRYNPGSNSWVPMPSVPGLPSGRQFQTAVWTGTELIVWGGMDAGNTNLNSGGRYNLATDSWVATSLGANVPSPRANHAAVWTGTEMIVWGGTSLNSGGRYNPASDSWTPTANVVSTPAGRSYLTAVWTGTAMVVWGGSVAGNYMNSGGRYDPSSDTWTPVSMVNALSPRDSHTAIWTGTRMIVWGGYDSNELGDGRLYDPSSDNWTPVSMINAASPRDTHTAVWTGTKMIVWGGYGDMHITGGLYDPMTDQWTPASQIGSPIPRVYHSAVWTGSEMIVWGGGPPSIYGGYNTGGRYDPRTDSWKPTSLMNVPAARAWPSLAWIGDKMLVWGGYPFDVNLGLYCADVCADPSLTFYRDQDGDGYGDPLNLVRGCAITPGYVEDGTDCNDNDPLVHPGAVETCNGVDDDCDGTIDNGAEPGEVIGVGAAKSGTTASYTWPARPEASWYDAVRGTIGAWPVGSAPAAESCLSDNHGTTIDDADVPSAGQGYWYVFRAENICGNGTYGSQETHGVPTATRVSNACP